MPDHPGRAGEHASQSRQFTSEGKPAPAASVWSRFQHGVADCEFADAVLEPAAGYGTNLQVPQEPSHGRFERDHSLLDDFPGTGRDAELLRRNRLAVNRADPGEMKKAGIPRVSRLSVFTGTPSARP